MSPNFGISFSRIPKSGLKRNVINDQPGNTHRRGGGEQAVKKGGDGSRFAGYRQHQKQCANQNHQRESKENDLCRG